MVWQETRDKDWVPYYDVVATSLNLPSLLRTRISSAPPWSTAPLFGQEALVQISHYLTESKGVLCGHVVLTQTMTDSAVSLQLVSGPSRKVSGVAPEAMTAHCPTYFTAPRTSRSATDAHPYRLTVSRSRTSRQAASFLQKTVRRWNDLPPSILSGQLQSLDHFKAQVNQLDLSLF